LTKYTQIPIIVSEKYKYEHFPETITG